MSETNDNNASQSIDTPPEGDGVSAQTPNAEGGEENDSGMANSEVEVPDAGSLKQEPVTLDEEDEKIAKKKAKKGGMSEEDARHLRFLQLASPKVQRLWLEFGLQMAMLGHVLEPVLNFTPQGITPSIKFRAMDRDQMEKTKERVGNSIKEMEDFYRGQKQTEPEGATEEVTPAAPDETVK
jgi:hypothetical protein